MSYAFRAERYAQAVVAGDVVACRYVRLACERHLADLEAQRTRDFPYRFDRDVVDRACAWVELLPHIKGRWARAADPNIRLEDWQCFWRANVFGWLRKHDGLRRFRRVYLEIPRKNAKSTEGATTALYCLAADGEYGAEVYCGATSERQAFEVFRPARLMAARTDALREAYGIHVGARNLSISLTGSKFEPVIGKPGDGASPSLAIIDEYHEHPTDDQYDTMLSGMGAREQPLLLVITTAGSDTEGPCYALRSEVIDMLEGRLPNDELFGAIYTIDEGDDPYSEEALRKANPNYGVSIDPGYLRSQQRDAERHPRRRATFMTKHLDVWVNARDPYFDAEAWKRLGDPALELAAFAGSPCWAGVDLSSKIDLSARALVFRREEAGVDHYYAFFRCYCPEARLEEPTLKHYAEWAEQGHLIATGGNIIDYDRIREDLEADDHACHLHSLGYDPWGATQLATQLQEKGLEIVEVPQRVNHLSEPMKWVDALVRAGRFHHDGNPCVTWQFGNVVAKVDANDNVFPRRETREKKIDAAVALIIAMALALRQGGEGGSVYEDRGVIAL